MSRISRLALAPLLAVPLTSFIPAPAASAVSERTLDILAHRGGLGLTVESTVPAFAKALELGVSTLELDVQITEDRVVVVTHDPITFGTTPIRDYLAPPRLGEHNDAVRRWLTQETPA